MDSTRAQAARRLTLAVIEIVDGPLDTTRLESICRLYGAVDPKYRSPAYVAHLFDESPAGPGLHAFAVDEGRAVGHVAVARTLARHGTRPLSAGKLEALVVAPSHRGGPAPIVRTMLDRLYARADEVGVDLIHAYVSPPIGRIIRFARLDDVGRPSVVAVVRPRSAAERVLAAVQRAAIAVAPRVETVVRRVGEDDRDLLETPARREEAWAVVGDGALDWYARSPHVRVVELAEGSRLLVQLPGSSQDPLRVAGWRAGRSGTSHAVSAIAAAFHLAREAGASTLRVHSPDIAGSARLLGFVPRRDLTTLWVRARDPSLARRDAVVATPFLYLGF